MADREKLIELMHEHNAKHPAFCDFCFNKTKEELDATIAGVADHLISHGVTVRERGRWEDVSLRFTQVKEKCSVCGGIVYAHGFNFCPNCGADMK